MSSNLPVPGDLSISATSFEHQKYNICPSFLFKDTQTLQEFIKWMFKIWREKKITEDKFNHNM
jgi:hypothetical protein